MKDVSKNTAAPLLFETKIFTSVYKLFFKLFLDTI